MKTKLYTIFAAIAALACLPSAQAASRNYPKKQDKKEITTKPIHREPKKRAPLEKMPQVTAETSLGGTTVKSHKTTAGGYTAQTGYQVAEPQTGGYPAQTGYQTQVGYQVAEPEVTATTSLGGTTVQSFKGAEPVASESSLGGTTIKSYK